MRSTVIKRTSNAIREKHCAGAGARLQVERSTQGSAQPVRLPARWHEVARLQASKVPHLSSSHRKRRAGAQGGPTRQEAAKAATDHGRAPPPQAVATVSESVYKLRSRAWRAATAPGVLGVIMCSEVCQRGRPSRSGAAAQAPPSGGRSTVRIPFAPT